MADRLGLGIAAIAAQEGIPKATAHRQVATFLHEGLLRRLANGRLVAGPRLLSVAALADYRQTLVSAASPVLNRLAKQLHCVAQLGTLENDMVTYHYKAGELAGELFTRVGLQLEAYCTGIGKMLLAQLPPSEQEAYLATGPFPALTATTIVDPAKLRAELLKARKQGFAEDNEEIAPGLACIAVPVRHPAGEVVAAISVSMHSRVFHQNTRPSQCNALLAAAKEIETLLQ